MRFRLVCALLFVAWTAESPHDPSLYSGLWRSPFQMLGSLVVPLPGIELSPWQLLIILLVPACLVRRGSFRPSVLPMYAAVALSFSGIVVTVAWGLYRGGSLYYSYFQLWRFLTGLLVVSLILAAARTARDLRALGATILAAALARGGLAIYFYFVHAQSMDPPPLHMTNHEDSLLFVAGITIMVSWALARGSLLSSLAALAMSAILAVAMALNNRRLAWMELLIVLFILYLLAHRRARRRMNLLALVGVPILLLYAAIGWGRPEAAFAPLRALETTGSDADSSSRARLEENRNLVYTLVSSGNPLMGSGWGVPYVERTDEYSRYLLFWELYPYLPHNSLLGLIAFSGLVGLAFVWLPVPMGAFMAARGYRRPGTETDRAAAMASVGVLAAFAAQCYGDIGFQMLTCTLLFASAAGSAAIVSSRSVRAGRRSGPSKLDVDGRAAHGAAGFADQLLPRR